jgi:hypothetical protein
MAHGQQDVSVMPTAYEVGGGAAVNAAPADLSSEAADCRVRGWIDFDYLLFFPEEHHLPANLATGPNGTVVGTSANVGSPPGFQIDTGLWLDSDQSVGCEALVDVMFRGSTTTPLAPGDTLNTNGGANVFTLAGTGGTFTAWSQFNNVESNLLLRLACNNTFQLYGLGGPRLMTLREADTFDYMLGGFGISSANFEDEFNTTNIFVGGQLGALLKADFGCRFSADVAAKCGLGWNAASVDVLGSNNTPIAIPGTGGALTGANTQVFTNDANMGYRDANYFSVVPELQANLNFQVTERIQLRLGYSALWWTSSLRPGDQINPSLAPIAGIGGTHTAPTLPFVTETFSLQAINFGGTWKF